MKKTILIFLLLINFFVAQSQKYDLIVTETNDSIMCFIDSINDSKVYFEMKLNDIWYHTSMFKEDIKNVNEKFIIKKEYLFKEGSSFIIQKKRPQDKFCLSLTAGLGASGNGILYYYGINGRYKRNLFALRMVDHHFKNRYSEESPFFPYLDSGILYGYNFGKYPYFISVFTGISTVKFIIEGERIATYHPAGYYTPASTSYSEKPDIYFYRFGIPIEVRIGYINKKIGIGLMGNANFNNERNTIGGSLFVQFYLIK